MIATSYNTDSNSSKPHTAARYSSPTAALSESFKGLRASASPWSVSSTLSSSTNNSPFPQSNLPMTICLADISPPPISPGYQQLFEEESEVPAETDTCDHPPSVIPTEAPEDFCSSSESEDEKPLASASVPTRRAVGQKSKRASRDVESDGEDDDDDYVPRPQVRGAPSNLRKRIRAHYVLPKLEPELVSSVAGPTSTLTPALCAASMQPATPAPVLPELSAASPAPFCDESDDDTVMSPPATSAYKPKKKRRTARRQNNKAKLPRAKCAFCPKQFGRPKDRDRHEVYSCELNPNKAGSLCEECGELLSRPDSAQRHLKVHQSRGLPPPTVLSRL
ncbi:hypothetical protein FA95DRAFT_872248 [Auriscalpium vulgare]|uniref:Uncharacterized protein n=1 Tax=Auriscalpium vulgare TaxID=40419 RepID=A0ACB8S0R6_9AGAM|nr:hypothetical protein FA95DRAFT_872248 [Auriscalpium vulgare]